MARLHGLQLSSSVRPQQTSMVQTLLLLFALGALATVVIMWSRRSSADGRTPNAEFPIGDLGADQQTLRALRDAGADLTKPTEINFYLYFPTRAAADTAATQAATPQLRPHVDRAANGPTWLCLLTGNMVPTESAVHAESVRLGALAKAHSGEYDGWEAAVTK